jgi:hypothetical protein
MNKGIILIEHLSPIAANLIVEENQKTKESYLSGIFMQDCLNGNGRVYPISELTQAVESVNKRISEGYSVYGELNHPDNLNIDLNNVSHIITKMHMEGGNAIGKAKILNTPKGQIVKAIIEGGGKLGVVEGKVNTFSLVTVDIVAQPSAPDAYPSHVMEALNDNQKIQTLAEAVCHDQKAQKHLALEVRKFLDSLLGR